MYVARSNPLYKEQESDYYEVLSLSSGYYSTYRREPHHSAGNQDQLQSCLLSHKFSVAGLVGACNV